MTRLPADVHGVQLADGRLVSRINKDLTLRTHRHHKVAPLVGLHRVLKAVAGDRYSRPSRRTLVVAAIVIGHVAVMTAGVVTRVGARIIGHVTLTIRVTVTDRHHRRRVFNTLAGDAVVAVARRHLARTIWHWLGMTDHGILVI